MSKSNLNRIPTKTIKSILDENYIRGVNGKDYEECKDELAAILWKREERLGEIELGEREQSIDQELERFKTEFKCLTAWLFTFGDSKYLRDQINTCINEYTLFCEAT